MYLQLKNNTVDFKKRFSFFKKTFFEVKTENDQNLHESLSLNSHTLKQIAKLYKNTK